MKIGRWKKLAVLALLAGNASVAWAGSSLVEAVKNHDEPAIRALLKEHADVNTAEPDGTTALHWAAYLDDLDAANLLIHAGADVRMKNRHGVAPLSLACLNGNAALVEALLKSGADPNTTRSEGETALMTCSRTGKADAVKVLIAHGANVNAEEDWRGQTALMWAAAEGNTAVVRVLADSGADLTVHSKGGLSALHFAAREGKIDVLRALIEAGGDANDATLPPPTARRNAAGQADTGEPAAGTSALVLAVANAHYELASALLDAGADPNADGQGWTALHQVTWVRNPGYGANRPAPEGSGDMDSLQLVQRLVAHGANVNARMTKKAEMGSTDLNNKEATPFLLASRAADTELMQLLVKLGADPLLPNADNTTPLLAAAGVGTHSPGEDAGTEADGLAAVRLALELGGDVNAVDNNGESAMHGAAYKQFPTIVKFLADNGAKTDVWNQKNKYGWTPLMIAEGVQRGNNIRVSAATAAELRKVLQGRSGVEAGQRD